MTASVPVKFAKAVASAAAEMLWPQRCVSCGEKVPQRTDVWPGFAPPRSLCARCRALIIKRNRDACCPRCGKTLLEGELDSATHAPRCKACIDHPPAYDGAWSAADYRGTAGLLVRRLKYGRDRLVADEIAALMSTAFRDRFAGETPDLIVPVPLHPARLLKRGFNQAAEIARALAKRLDLPESDNVLRRIRDTATQTRMNAAERRINARGAFECPESFAPVVFGRSIVLVDDVMTTGATFDACAAALRAKGAVRVLCLSAARD